MKYENFEILEIRRRSNNPYDEFMEIHLSNGEYIFLNINIWNLSEIGENENIPDEDEIIENFGIYHQSIIDDIDLDLDRFYEKEMEKSIPIEEYEKRISDREILNQYIRLINRSIENIS